MHQNLTAGLDHLVRLASHQEGQRLVLATRDLDMGVGFLHDVLAGAQRFALAKLVRVVLALAGRHDEDLRHDRAADTHALRGRRQGRIVEARWGALRQGREQIIVARGRSRRRANVVLVRGVAGLLVNYC